MEITVEVRGDTVYNMQCDLLAVMSYYISPLSTVTSLGESNLGDIATIKHTRTHTHTHTQPFLHCFNTYIIHICLVMKNVFKHASVVK